MTDPSPELLRRYAQELALVSAGVSQRPSIECCNAAREALYEQAALIEARNEIDALYNPKPRR